MTVFKRISSFLKDRGVQPKELIIWFPIVLIILAAGIILGSIPNRDNQVFPVRISEVLASNTSYPNSSGRCSDYIEIYNQADYPVDLSGFQLGDISGKARYIFQSGTVIQPHTYLLIYCDKTVDDPFYAPFEISRAGNEDFYLISKDKAIVDSVTTLAMDVDESMIIQPDGKWMLSASATPGTANSNTGIPNGNIYNSSVSPLRISEFSTADTTYLSEYGILCDWIELCNTSHEPLDISGYILTDNVGNDKYFFPSGSTVPPGGYVVVNCSDRIKADGLAPFGLSKNNVETLVLKNPSGMIIEMVSTEIPLCGTMALGEDGVWAVSSSASPGYENTTAGCEKFLSDIGAKEGSIRISELMAAEQYFIADKNGEFSDWVEIYNTTDEPISLGGWALSDDPTDPMKWIFPQATIGPKEYLVIFCSGRGSSVPGEIHAEFALSAGGESLYLSSYAGNIVDSIVYSEAKEHTSLVFEDGNQAITSNHPTPAYPNTKEGYEAFCAASLPCGPIAIWEVMTSNNKYLPQRLGQCFDWVELKNISNSPVNLSDYYISDDCDVHDMHALPDVTLAPGHSHIVILTDDSSMVNTGYDYAAINLDAQEDQLFLYDKNAFLVDFVYLNDVPRNCSYGRSEDSGGFGYMEPSPGIPNYAGCRLISLEPVSSYVPGVYSQEGSFTVELKATGDIYYTTDGSIPSAESNKYENALQLDKTTVLRAVSIEEGKLKSDVYTATFIVGDHHELPVVSLVAEPSSLWGPYGIYKNNDISVKEIQVPAHVSYSGEDGSFALDCAMNLHGATTVTHFNKKSFAVRFLDSYDGPLHYDVFGDGEVTSFSSLIIRNSIESSFSSQMHDAMIGYIASQCSDTVLSQKYKYVSLYLNGEYWGLYALRERHSQEHFASYMNVPAEEVEIVRYMTSARNDLYDLYNFIDTNSFRSEENYAYAKSVLDMESFVDWIIFEAYMANVDINGNIRYYRNPVSGIWQMGLADLDLGIVGSYTAFDEVAGSFHHGRMVTALMDNEEFKDLLASRLAELLAGPLSDESVLALIDDMAAVIRPEASWEEARWDTPVYGWEAMVNYMIDFCDGRAGEMINSLCKQLRFTEEQREAYFGDLE